MDDDSSVRRVRHHHPRSTQPAEPLAPLGAPAAPPATSTARDGEGDGQDIEPCRQAVGDATHAGRSTLEGSHHPTRAKPDPTRAISPPTRVGNSC